MAGTRELDWRCTIAYARKPAAAAISPPASTQFACGDVQQLDPAQHQHRGEPEPQHAVGHVRRELAREQHAGDRAGQQPHHRPQVDVAGDEVAEAGDPEQRRRVEDVGADDLRQREREDEHHHEPEEGAAADRGQADDEAAGRAEREGDQLVAALEDERRVVGLDAALDERLGDEPAAADHERGADRVGLDVLGAVA